VQPVVEAKKSFRQHHGRRPPLGAFGRGGLVLSAFVTANSFGADLPVRISATVLPSCVVSVRASTAVASYTLSPEPSSASVTTRCNTPLQAQTQISPPSRASTPTLVVSPATPAPAVVHDPLGRNSPSHFQPSDSAGGDNASIGTLTLYY